MSRRTPVVAIVVLAAVLAVSCGNRPQDGTPEPYSERVGPDGGTIEDPAGTTLDIPAGALDSPTSITVTTFDQATDFAAALGFPAPTGVLCGVRLEPDSLEFAKPVTLSLPTPSYLEVDTYSLCFWNEKEERWEYEAEATVAVSGTAEAQITHFCSYAIFDVPPGVLAEFGRIVEDPEYASYTLEEWGALYQGYLEEEVDLLSGGLLYQGCCYDGMAFTVHVDYYPAEGEAGSYDGKLGEPTEISYTVTYSDGASYSMELTQYLRCSEETSVGVLAADTSLEAGESTDLTVYFECGSTAVAGREIALELDGPGKLSATSVLTNEAGEATASYTAEEEGTAVITAKVGGCSCDELGALWSQDEVTITVGSQQSGTEKWAGALTFHQGGDARRFYEPSEPHCEYTNNTKYSVDVNAVVNLTFDVYRSGGYWSVLSANAIGSVEVDVTPGAVEWRDNQDGSYYSYTDTYSVASIDVVNDIGFTWSYVGGDHMLFIYDDTSTSDSFFIEFHLDMAREGYYYGPPEDEYQGTDSYPDDAKNLATEVEITFDAPFTDGFQEGTFSGTEGDCLYYEEEDLPISWTLTLDRLD